MSLPPSLDTILGFKSTAEWSPKIMAWSSPPLHSTATSDLAFSLSLPSFPFQSSVLFTPPPLLLSQFRPFMLPLFHCLKTGLWLPISPSSLSHSLPVIFPPALIMWFLPQRNGKQFQNFRTKLQNKTKSLSSPTLAGQPTRGKPF